MSIDLSWVLIIAVFWIGGLSLLAGMVWLAGALLAHRDQAAQTRRPLAPLVELDLHRAARRPTARGAHVNHLTPGDIA